VRSGPCGGRGSSRRCGCARTRCGLRSLRRGSRPERGVRIAASSGGSTASGPGSRRVVRWNEFPDRASRQARRRGRMIGGAGRKTILRGAGDGEDTSGPLDRPRLRAAVSSEAVDGWTWHGRFPARRESGLPGGWLRSFERPARGRPVRRADRPSEGCTLAQVHPARAAACCWAGKSPESARGRSKARAALAGGADLPASVAVRPPAAAGARQAPWGAGFI